jgi:predicted SnoaL-like aldol condensation-catalyzing enzyme
MDKLSPILLLFVLIGLYSCNKQAEVAENDTSNEIIIETIEQPKVNKIVFQYPYEKYNKDREITTCETNVLEDNVNMRKFPNIDAKVVYQLSKDDIVKIVGFHNTKETIDDYEGAWINIFFMKDEKTLYEGWVFSKYINIGEKEYSAIKFLEIIPKTGNKISLLKFSYIINGVEHYIQTDYNEWNGFYVIVRGPYENWYHYTNQPGIYLLDKNTMELKHMTYLGTTVAWPHAWTVFTDDYKYLIQDSGSSPGPRGITVYNCETMEITYSGTYYGRKIYNHTIEVVYSCDEWNLTHGYTDEEIIEYGKKYKEENDVPEDIKQQQEETGLYLDFLVRCSINLDTGERKIIEGQYYLTQ